MSVVVQPGPVAVVEIRHPERANAYGRATLEALEEALVSLAGTARVLVVQTAGEGAFCGGAHREELSRAAPEDALDLRSQRIFDALARAPFASIAAIQGPAVAGGFELALACDLRVAAPAARFSLPEPSLGLIPSAGGTTRLAAAVGTSRARAVIVGGLEVDAETALSWGLVHRLHADPRAEARRWAGEVAKRDPVALRLARQVMDRSLGAGLEMERLAEALLYARR